jgi:hypothetical protein
MSLGLYLDPQPLADDLMYNNNLVGKFCDVMSDLGNSMLKIIDDDSMEGAAYTAMKDRLKNYDYPLINGFRLLAADLPGVYRLHFANLQSVLDLTTGLINENAIDQQTSQLQEAINWDLTRIESVTPDSSPGDLQAAQSSASDLEYQEKILKPLQDKETVIEAYAASTTNIYSDVSSLIVMIQRGVAYIQSLTFNGSAWTSPSTDTGWQQGIGDSDQTLRLDLNNEDIALTQQNPNIMALSLDGQAIYYKGIAYQVYDPSTDPDFYTSKDPILENGWTTKEFKPGEASTQDSALTVWTNSQYPNTTKFDSQPEGLEGKSPAEKGLEETKGGLSLLESYEEAVMDSKHDAYIGLYFQQNGDKHRVVIATSTNDYKDGYTNFSSNGRVHTTIKENKDNGSTADTDWALANALQTMGIDAYPNNNVANAAQGRDRDASNAR